MRKAVTYENSNVAVMSFKVGQTLESAHLPPPAHGSWLPMSLLLVSTFVEDIKVLDSRPAKTSYIGCVWPLASLFFIPCPYIHGLFETDEILPPWRSSQEPSTLVGGVAGAATPSIPYEGIICAFSSYEYMSY